MKNLYKSFFILCLLLIVYSCGKGFLEQKPQAILSEEQLKGTKGVESALIGAYGIMNGNISGTWGNYSSSPSQWLFGEVGSDNAHKGSNSLDQSPMNDIELHRVDPSNDNLPTMWRVYYEGIGRCNLTLSLLKAVQEGSGEKLSDQRAKEITGEARLLRGHYYFFLARVFRDIPYVDETMSTQDAAKVKNDKDVFPMIEADFKAAIDNLPAEKPLGDVGRGDKRAAQAYLGKLYLYQKKYAEALPLFQEVINNKPALSTLAFDANFNIKTKNGPEGILVSQSIINPDGSGDNGNVGDMLGGLYGGPINCCGFFQPTVDLVNSFKVDANGLPFLDGSYRNNPYVSDQGLTGAERDNYKVNTAIAFDPRLDYTVGRRDVNYRDWGVLQSSWIRDQAFSGPFVGVKQMINVADMDGNVSPGTSNITAQNVNIIRLSDVYLMAAECAVETNALPLAMNMVNAVRLRAANLPAVKASSGAAAAQYMVKPYTSFPNQAYARNAVRFERRLELALEGHRFFDLVRWGTAKSVLEPFMEFEKKYVAASRTITYTDKNNYLPLPQEQIDRAQGALTQNQ